MKVKIPVSIGKRYWMRRLPFNLKVKLVCPPNHPETVYYILMR